MSVGRRVFVAVVAGGGAGWGWFERGNREAERRARLPSTVRIAEFDGAGVLVRVVDRAAVRRSDAEWRQRLAVDQYMVTRRGDTELAYAGEFWNFHGDGLYFCVCCGTALFDSRAKFASGTGWPSFTEPIARENVIEGADGSFGMARTEVRCRGCDGHLGHVFRDGPGPAGLRYCVNSVAMVFRGREPFA